MTSTEKALEQLETAALNLAAYIHQNGPSADLTVVEAQAALIRERASRLKESLS